jgi:hypothetical protein
MGKYDPEFWKPKLFKFRVSGNSGSMPYEMDVEAVNKAEAKQVALDRGGWDEIHNIREIK